MENLLRSKELWGVIETAVVEPARGTVLTDTQKKTLEENKLKDLKAKNYLFQAIDKNILKTIAEKTSSKQVWDSLKTKFQGSDKVRRAQLNMMKREFEILEMKNGESVTEYVGRVMVIVNNMKSLGKTMRDEKVVAKILRTLTEKFNYIVCSIEESKDTSKLSIDELQSSLILHEQKFKFKEKEEHLLRTSEQTQKAIDDKSDGSIERTGSFAGFGERTGGFGGRWRGRGGGFRGRGRGRGYNPKANVECFK